MNIKTIYLILFLLSHQFLPDSYAQVADDRASFRKISLLKGSFSLYADTTIRTPIVIESHIITGNERVRLDVPVQGLWLVLAMAGEFKTIGNGKEQEYNNGDLWVMTPSADFIVQTEDDAAILQVYAIGEDYLTGRGVIPFGKVFSPSTEPYKLLVKNAFAKESYIIGNQQNPIIKVLDINVGPGLKTDELRFEGPSTVQVLTGEGIIMVENRAIKSPLGKSLAINPRKSFTIENSGRSPLKIRMVIFQK